MAPSMPGAVAAARNISGGVNPPALLVCDCPVRRNRSGSRGPLSRLLGGHFHILGTLQRAYTHILIYQSKSTQTLESHSFLERALRHVGWTWPARTLTWAGSCQTWRKRERSSSRTYTLFQEPCALSYTKEVVIITDEPALVAEPGWLLSSRRAR